MSSKYKLKLKDLKLDYIKEYVSPIFNFLKPKKKITNISDITSFIQRKSAWVSQETLYGYLKTRMGTKYVLMFEDEIFLESINKAKWNIYSECLQDLTLYCLSYLKNKYNFDQVNQAQTILENIFTEEKSNGMPDKVIEKSKSNFANRIDNIDSSSSVYPTTDFVAPTEPDGDSTEAVYVTRKVTLKNPATALKVLHTAVRFANAEIQVMFKILRSDDESDFDELGFRFFNTNGGPDVVTNDSTTDDDHIEYEYSANDLEEFTAFAIKIRMQSSNSAQHQELRTCVLSHWQHNE